LKIYFFLIQDGDSRHFKHLKIAIFLQRFKLSQLNLAE